MKIILKDTKVRMTLTIINKHLDGENAHKDNGTGLDELSYKMAPL